MKKLRQGLFLLVGGIPWLTIGIMRELDWKGNRLGEQNALERFLEVFRSPGSKWNSYRLQDWLNKEAQTRRGWQQWG